MNTDAARMNALKDLHILIVDDQRYFRRIIAQSLKPLVAEITEADDGYGGVNALGFSPEADNVAGKLRQQRPDLFETGLFKPNKIDLVLTDIRMAPMNGLEMLKAIRIGYTAAPRDLPVIIMSAHSDESLIGAAVALDAHGFVSKPISQQTILNRISRSMRVRLTPKPIEVYRKLIIPGLDEISLLVDVRRPLNHTKSSIGAEDVNASSAEWAVRIDWQTLQEGDVTAADFKTLSGHLVVPAGTHVTELLVLAIQDLAHVTSLEPEIGIKRIMRS